MAMTYTGRGIGTHVLCPQEVRILQTQNDSDYNKRLQKSGSMGKLMEAEECATYTLDAMQQGKMLISTHTDEVARDIQAKYTNNDWYCKVTQSIHDDYIMGMKEPGYYE